MRKVHRMVEAGTTAREEGGGGGKLRKQEN